MSLIGSVGEFLEDGEDFESYVSRVKLFFTANEIADKRKVPAFLSIIGPKAFALIKDLVSPQAPEEKTLDELIKTLKDHYKPKVIIIYERFKFYSRSQGDRESVSSFVAALKSLASTCDFGNTLEEMLRDRFVMGLNNEATQRCLLTESNLTFSKSVEIAGAREAAAKDVKDIGSHKAESLNNIQSKSSGKSGNFKASNNFKSSNLKSSSNFKSNLSKPAKPCSGCGGSHWKEQCQFKNATCFNCQKVGHITKVCFAKKKAVGQSKPNYNKGSANVVSAVSPDEYIFYESDDSHKNVGPFNLTPSVNGTKLKMQVDTGASKSLISKQSYYAHWPKASLPKLNKTNIVLRKYGGEPLSVFGEIFVDVEFQKCMYHNVPLLIVNDVGPNLMGRDWISKLKINLFKDENSILSLNSSNIVSAHPNLFKPELGTMKDVKAKIEIDVSKPAKFCKARPVPYALKAKVDQALDSLIEQDIITPIANSDWAAPIVPVLKSDGKVRLCGDYRLTVNQVARMDCYPIPKIEDLFSALSGGKIFSKLDMSQAYMQLILSDESKPLTTINTHRGLFMYNRLCFGVSTAPGIFQRQMENILRGMPGVLCYLDDILVAGSNEDEHSKRLHEVLQKLQDAGLRLQPNKCSFGVKNITYLGFAIDENGLKPTEDKLRAIKEAPEPKDVVQLRSYLGLMSYYRKFLSKAASLLEPLNKLLRHGVEWEWGAEQKKAFNSSKAELLESCLIHFDPKLPVVVSGDSSAYGVGAVLCHIKDGQELPVAFVSRTLNVAERKYSQIEKEGLAMIFALKRFHHYLWGRKFTLVTDHKPLLGLFNPQKPIPAMASGRIQRWALMMQAYSFDLMHRSGKCLGAADTLSRLPLKDELDIIPICSEWVQLVDVLDKTPVTAKDIKNWTTYDPILSQVLLYCENGWPSNVDKIYSSYFCRRTELSTQDGCILWGSRVIVPEKGRKSMLDELHKGHLGSTKMKQLARSYVWWPNLDADLESVTNQCAVCLANRQMPNKAALHPWEWPSKPWHRVHADYAGPVAGSYFLVIVDAHSKWIEILPTKSITSTVTIKLMRKVFCRYGLPVTLVTDNGTNFTSDEFETFMVKNGIHHIKSAPYQPSTNGQAENLVKSFKAFLKANNYEWEVGLDKFLFRYRITPHTTTGVTPSELMFGRKLRSVLDLVHPSKVVANQVFKKQEDQKKYYDSRNPRILDLHPRSTVMVRNYGTTCSDKWLPATVSEKTGPVSYRCELGDGREIRRHQNQIHLRELPFYDNNTTVPDIVQENIEPKVAPPIPNSAFEDNPVPIRRSGRTIKPPERLNL